MRLRQGDRIHMPGSFHACVDGWWEWCDDKWFALEIESEATDGIFGPAHFGAYVEAFGGTGFMLPWMCVAEQLIAEGAMRVPNGKKEGNRP